MSANGMQQSAETATRNGIQALEMAFSGIVKSRQDVEATKFNLSSGYQGSDGNAFQSLITAWEEQADVILKNVEDMIETLNHTLTEHGLQQGSSNEQINTAYNQSASVFDTLTG
ncbi:hypothetical protein ACFYW6_16720 [Streptomyces sp. NPDC002659]|uniref:hypothetical protein n=1 Tax=unclassified Streptomyces TaxID=2593676 RepID=UPI0036BC80A1|nr:hypothetical protein OH805_03620 [Streptomyces sp. NBC_00879]